MPRVTVYLLVGFALGPYALARGTETGSFSSWFLLGPGTQTPLDIVSELAIGFVLFGIGGNFLLGTLRRVGLQIWALSGAEIATTSLLVGAAVGAGTGDWRLALIAPDDPLAEALERMDARHLPSWPVVEDGILAGMVRRSDTLRTHPKGKRRAGLTRRRDPFHGKGPGTT